MKFIDLIGQRFGHWVVLHRLPLTRGGTPFLCRCDCGTEHAVTSGNLKRGFSTNCGCYQRERLSVLRTTHGCAGNGHAKRKPSAEYKIWIKMKDRCVNPKVPNYADYGGRGIHVCEEWARDFAAFLRDMGKRPSPVHSIERLDNNGPYEKTNCKWATPVEQANNKRNNKHVAVNGQQITIAEAARFYGVRYHKFWSRITSGMSLERASQQFLRARDHHRSPLS